MEHVIHKYALPVSGIIELELPEGSTFLTVADQHNKPVLYVKKPRHEMKTKRFEVFPVLTGGVVFSASTWSYIGTVLLNSESFIVHYFYR